MKITKTQLKQIIKEEIKRILNESERFGMLEPITAEDPLGGSPQGSGDPISSERGAMLELPGDPVPIMVSASDVDSDGDFDVIAVPPGSGLADSLRGAGVAVVERPASAPSTPLYPPPYGGTPYGAPINLDRSTERVNQAAAAYDARRQQRVAQQDLAYAAEQGRIRRGGR